MAKKSAMTSVLTGLQETLAARRAQLNKAASDGGLSTTQGTSEGGVASPSTEPILSDILPSTTVPGEPAKDLAGELGVPTGTPVPGQPSPSETEKERKEQSPDSKLASLGALSERLAGLIKNAADKVAADLAKKADGLPAPGSDDPATVPPIPSGGKDLSEGGGGTNTDTKEVPKVLGVQGVTQTEIFSGKSEGGLTQGATEQKVGAAIDLDELSNKIAQASHHYGIGQALGYQLVSMMDVGKAKTAAAELPAANDEAFRKVAYKAANDVLALGFQAGIITEAQATAIQKQAGITPHPLDVAINKYQAKVAALMKDKNFTPDATVRFISKLAMHDDAGAAAMAGGDPAAGGQVQPEMHEVVAQIAQAVESGQMSEEQAMQVLQELGIPVEDILAAQQGAGGMEGAVPPGADPAAAGGAGPGMPPGADPAMAGGAASAASGGPVPQMDDPAAAAAVGGAIDPAAAGGAPPAGPAGGPPPPDIAAVMGGAPAGAPPGAGGPPPEIAAGGGGEGGGAAPEKKSEGDGEKKEKSDDKKDDKGDGKKEEKKDDKKDDDKKEASRKVAAGLAKAVGFTLLHNEVVDQYQWRHDPTKLISKVAFLTPSDALQHAIANRNHPQLKQAFDMMQAAPGTGAPGSGPVPAAVNSLLHGVGNAAKSLPGTAAGLVKPLLPAPGAPTIAGALPKKADGDPMAAMGGAPPPEAMPPEGAAPAGPEGGAGGDPQQLLQQIVQDLQAAVQGGMMTEQQAQEVLSELAGGGAGGDPAAQGAPAPAPTPDPAAGAGAPPPAM